MQTASSPLSANDDSFLHSHQWLYPRLNRDGYHLISCLLLVEQLLLSIPVTCTLLPSSLSTSTAASTLCFPTSSCFPGGGSCSHLCSQGSLCSPLPRCRPHYNGVLYERSVPQADCRLSEGKASVLVTDESLPLSKADVQEMLNN